jgi:hypothetical protein
MMNIAIRLADLEADKERLVETLSQSLNPRADCARFDWLYRNNPYGQARVWVAIDTAKDTVVGMASAFPRRVYVGGREELGWVLGDFCINDQYRSLGPALQLQRACLEDVEAGRVAFCYDFPNASMMAIYKRLRINTFGQVLRLAKPLRVDRKIRETINTPVVTRGLGAIGNLWLALGARQPKENSMLTISLHNGECGEEFSALAREISGQDRICVQHSAAYLNWRYLANTYCCHEVLTARLHGVLLAYAVFAHVGEDALLVDLCGVEDPAVISTLIRRAVGLLRERGVITVSTPMLESHPWVPLLQHLGFRAREAKPMIMYASPRFMRSRFERMKWLFMHGDRDS